MNNIPPPPPQSPEEEKAAVEYIARVLWWVRRGPRSLILLFGMMMGTAGTGAWIGTQVGDVTQTDIAAVNIRIDTINFRFDSLKKGLKEAEISSNEKSKEQNDKLDLLLRLNCPTISRADLVRECRLQGITK